MTAAGVEMGKYLAHLRDKAGFKQNELAQKVTWSPAVLSRVETGERDISTDELNSILEAIGTEEALRFRETAGRVWLNVEKPPPGHPDEELLWRAEQALRRIEELSESPQIRNVFVKRLKEYRDELEGAASLVLGTEHSVAFVGKIGVGKTTTICRVADLEVQKEKINEPVLDVGGGGVTVCEVHLVQGPQYGLIVEPMGENEIRKEVIEFADFLMPSSETLQEEEIGDPDSHGTSKEIERAIRNMSGLLPRRVRKEEKSKAKRVDPAKILAAKFTDSNALAVEILAKMDLQKRTKRELWISETSSEESLLWLQKHFEQVNNGRHPDFSIPKRIDITVPREILGKESLSIRVVDTKGIDRTAERRDLEEHFYAPNTIVILCSSFNDAPSAEVQQLLERAREGQFANLETKTAIVIFPQSNQALAVKDDEGFPAETVDDGYELKGEQVEMRLEGLRVPGVQIEFFNAFEDNPERLRVFLVELINSLRKKHCKNLRKAIDGANDLVQNFEKEQVQEVQRRAARSLIVWMKDNQQIGSFSKNVQDSLLSAIPSVHASSVRASVRRLGEWYSLDYSHQLGYGARVMVAAAVRVKQKNFQIVAKNLLQDSELEEAFSLVRQALHILDSGTEDLLEKSRRYGTTIHTEYMKPDAGLWIRSRGEWGQGRPRYRDRVSEHHRKWFAGESDETNQRAFTQTLVELAEKEWQEILKRLEAILDATKEDVG